MNADYPQGSLSKIVSVTRIVVQVLLIEDNHSYAELVKVLLSASPEQDCKVSVADTLHEGLQQLESSKDYDVVLLDLNLPDSRGLDTLRRILMAFPNTNIIVLTGSNDREQGAKAVALGAQDYLVKGEFEPHQLARALRFSMERKQILSRLEEAQQIAHIGNWEIRPHEDYFFASKEVYNILNFTPQRAVSTYSEICSPDCPFNILLLQEDTPDLTELSRSLQWELPDGSTCYTLLNSRRVTTPSGDINYIGTLQDVTLQRKAEELQRSQELAEKTASVREQVIANVSHELRTPMNAIVGMSNLLANTPLNEEQQQCLGAVQEASQLLLGIINDILLTSSLQNGEIEINPVPFDLPLTIRRIIEVLKPRATAKGLGLTYELSTPIAEQRLIGDKQRLSQVLYNILGNAVKFTEAGEIQLVIYHQEMDEEGLQMLFFEVCDTGPGIPEDKLDEIFQAFSRISTPGKRTEGTGLGLSIAKQMVEQMGGRIDVKSTLGEGSIFTFCLPFAIESTRQQHLPLEEIASLSNFSALQLSRILIVEDHYMNQIVLKKTLQQQWPDIALIIANDGEQAIEHLKNGVFDLVFMDIQLPGMDGFATTRYIRTQLSIPHSRMPVLAMTAQAQIAEDERYREAGMNDYILKPFDQQELFDKITQHLKTKTTNHGNKQ